MPDAFAGRVQRALPFLLAPAGAGGVAFLLPALLRATDAPGAPAAAEAMQHAAWLAALRQPQACLLPRMGTMADYKQQPACTCGKGASHNKL